MLYNFEQKKIVKRFLIWLLVISSFMVTAKPRDTAEIMQLMRQAKSIQYTSADSAILLYNKALEFSYDKTLNEESAKILLNLGGIYDERGEYRQSLNLFKQAYPYCIKAHENPYLIYGCYNSIGLSYLRQCNYPQAAFYYYKTIEELNDKKMLPSPVHVVAYNNLAIILVTAQHYKAALEYIQIGEYIARQQRFTRELGAILNTKGGILSETNRKSDAKLCYLEIIALSSRNNTVNYSSLLMTMADLGQLYSDEGNQKEGTSYFLRAIKLADKAHLPSIGIRASYLLATTYYNNKNYNEAANVLELAIQKAIKSEISEGLMAAHATLASVYQAQGKYRKALEQQLAYTAMKDSLLGKEKLASINNLEIKYRTAEKDKQIAIGNLQLAKQEKNLQRKNFWIGGIIAFFVMLGGIILFRNRQKQKLQNERIKSMVQEKEIKTMQAIMKGEENERARMAMELHDGIGGMLSSLQMHFKVLKKHHPELNGEKVFGETLDLLEETTNEVRMTAHNLMPELLLKHGAVEAIRIFCNRIKKGRDIEIEFHCLGDVKLPDESFALSLYRIVQELLQNIVKHACATHALVQISQHKGIFTLIVEDNGIGLSTGYKENGIGLENLRARIKSMEGQLNIESVPDTGTTVVVEIDLRKR